MPFVHARVFAEIEVARLLIGAQWGQQLGDIIVERGLVAPHLPDVVPVGGHNLGAQVALGEHRIAGDDRPAQADLPK